MGKRIFQLSQLYTILVTVLLWTTILSSQQTSRWQNDFLFLTLYVDDDLTYPLYYSNLSSWQSFVRENLGQHGEEVVERAEKSIQALMKEHQMPSHCLQGDWNAAKGTSNTSAILPTSQVLRRLNEGIEWDEETMFFTSSFTQKPRPYARLTTKSTAKKAENPDNLAYD